MKYFFPVAVLFLFAPAPLFAATLTLEPQEAVVGTTDPFVIALDLTSEEQVNAFALALRFSPEIYPVDISDGNSIVSIWLDQPHYDERTRTLTLSGVMPGGYSGEKGRVVLIRARAKETGTATISFVSTQSEVYTNGPHAERTALSLPMLSLEVRAGKRTFVNEPTDEVPPEKFELEIADAPDGSKRQLLSFAAQDKGSGVARYEVEERHVVFPWLVRTSQDAASPYLLRDQSRSSEIIVRAYDQRGNVRIESLSPENRAIRFVDIIAPLFLGGAILIMLAKLARRFARTV